MLYLRQGICRASPKAISGRTSYLRVRLEFLRYPRLIPTLFNGCGFGPPPPFTAASAWTWVGHPVSGLRQLTPWRALHARFHCGSAALRLNLASCRSSPDRSTKSTRSRFMRRSHSLWTQGFRFSFTPLPGSFSPFLHSTASLSVTGEYLGLGGGPPGFLQGFSCPVVLWILLAEFQFRLLDFHLLWCAFPKHFNYLHSLPYTVRNPEKHCLSVWPLPFSLAATQEIDFSFSSYCYLDVSVHSVSLLYAMDSHTDT